MSELFSAMPPIESLKLLTSIFTTKVQDQNCKLAFWDIKMAYFYGVSKRRVFTSLPNEEAEEGFCALLKHTMYGTQDASRTPVASGNRTGPTALTKVDMQRASPSRGVLKPPARLYWVTYVCHGDDFGSLATDGEIDRFENILKEKYDLLRTAKLGFGEHDDREVCFLNRLIRVVPERQCVEYEPDQRHSDLIVSELSLGQAQGVVTPRMKRKAAEVVAGNPSRPLSGGDASRYGSVTMRRSYLAQDRPDLSEAVKCRSRSMQDPREDCQELKGLGRYVKHRPRCTQLFERQKLPNKIRVYVDSDQSGDPVTRKSTTGYVAMFGWHVIKFGSNMQQSVLGPSSAEAEYHALTKGAAMVLGLKSLSEDWQMVLNCDLRYPLYSDSSAALSFASRRGLGTMRHVETRYLWLQDRVAKGHLSVHKVHTDGNVADVLTKAVAGNVLDRHLTTLGFEFRTGRSEKAKRRLGASDAQSKQESPSVDQAP